jgi:hypothetical protein
MDLAMVKQEQGETLRKHMRRFFDKRATVVDVTDKEVIDLFQDGLYHCRTFEDFGCRRPSSITKLKDMITSWADKEDKAKAKYDAIRGKSKQNAGGSNNNNRDQGGRNNNYSGPSQAQARQHSRGYLAPCERQLEKDLWRLQRLAEREVPVAPGGQPHYRTVLPTSASTQRHSGPTTSSRQERQKESRRRQRRLPRTRQDGERPVQWTTHQTVSEGHSTRSLKH